MVMIMKRIKVAMIATTKRKRLWKRQATTEESETAKVDVKCDSLINVRWFFLQYLLSVALHRSVPRLRSVTNTQSYAQANAQGSRMLGRQKQDSNACTGRPKRSHADSRRQEGENTVTAFQGVWARSPCTSSSAWPTVG